MVADTNQVEQKFRSQMIGMFSWSQESKQLGVKKMLVFQSTFSRKTPTLLKNVEPTMSSSPVWKDSSRISERERERDGERGSRKPPMPSKQPQKQLKLFFCWNKQKMNFQPDFFRWVRLDKDPKPIPNKFRKTMWRRRRRRRWRPKQTWLEAKSLKKNF